MLARHLSWGLAFAVVVVFVTQSCSSRRMAEASVASLLSGLSDSTRRNESACELIKRGLYSVEKPRYQEKVPERGCTVRSVFDERSRPRGAVAVLLKPDWDDPDLPERLDAGTLIVFDAEGRMVPVFDAANHLDASEGVVPYKADGSVAVAHQFAYGGEPDWSAEALHLVPPTVDQRPILSLFLGPPQSRTSESGKWGWKTSDIDGDKDLEIEIGPSNPDGSIETRATYRYSTAAGRYLGPEGSLSGDFYLVSNSAEKSTWRVAEDFARAHAIAVVPSKGCGECPNK